MTADTVGGVWTHALELAQGLEPFGHDVVLATMGAPATAQQRAEAHRRPNVILVESTFRLEWMRDPWDDVDRAGDWLLGLETVHRPEVVHLNGYAHGALPWRAPLLVAGHSCVRSWLSAVRGRTNRRDVPAEWSEYTRRAHAGLCAAGLVVAPTRAMLGALEEYYGPLNATEVILNGRDARRFTPARKEPLILSAGRLWDEAKNVAMLARVADDLPWPVAVAGSVASPDGAVMDLPASIRWLGQISSPTLAVWMARASIYALPARYEPFGLSALEAGLCGCALVLGDIASLREIWGDASVFASPDEDEGLASTIRALCDDPVRMRALGSRARARALELSPQRMSKQYADAYQRLVASRVVPAAEATACAS